MYRGGRRWVPLRSRLRKEHFCSWQSLSATFLHLNEIVERYHFHDSLSVFVSVCVRARACVCVCVCVRVCVCLSVSELNSSRIDAPIWTWFSLNSCLLHWLGSYKSKMVMYFKDIN